MSLTPSPNRRGLSQLTRVEIKPAIAIAYKKPFYSATVERCTDTRTGCDPSLRVPCVCLDIFLGDRFPFSESKLILTTTLSLKFTLLRDRIYSPRIC